MTKWPYPVAEIRRDWLHISEEYQVIEWSAIKFNSIIFLPLFINQQPTGKLKKYIKIK